MRDGSLLMQVVHIPNEMQSDAALESAINALEPPYKPTLVSIGHEIGSLPDKIEVRPLRTPPPRSHQG